MPENKNYRIQVEGDTVQHLMDALQKCPKKDTLLIASVGDGNIITTIDIGGSVITLCG